LPVVCPYVPEYNVHTYHLYVIRLKNRMEELSRYLNSSGIEARTYYPVPLHLQECYRNLGYRKGDLKESEKASEQTLSFAVYPELDKAEMNYIVEKIREFLRDNR
ncbi:MAG: DegT/DnrJ/EryC1/StrS family aminotransferase, partial [Candidatus Omnitrophica bacterium]|nr:DegT/DnrJ/EryC1/StrS family aminotransferase [Candidatus Omnitrophota bacterium]